MCCLDLTRHIPSRLPRAHPQRSPLPACVPAVSSILWGGTEDILPEATGSLRPRVPIQWALSQDGPPDHILLAALQITSNEKHLESLKNAGGLLQALGRLAPAGG